jgi:peptide deformylase
MKKIIVNKDAPVLRMHATPVLIKDIQTKKIQDIIKKMRMVLKKEDDGVAIAAPQIGESLRIFIESSKVADILNKN